MKYVDINGHKVDADKVDLFFSGKDGTPVTDEEWDESARRIKAAEASDEVTWTPIEDIK